MIRGLRDFFCGTDWKHFFDKNGTGGVEMKFLVLIAVLAMILAACGVFGDLAQAIMVAVGVIVLCVVGVLVFIFTLVMFCMSLNSL